MRDWSVDVFAVTVGEQAERTAPLDDREHLEPTVGSDQPGHRGVAGLVGRDDLRLVVGVATGWPMPDSSSSRAARRPGHYIALRPFLHSVDQASSNMPSSIAGL